MVHTKSSQNKRQADKPYKNNNIKSDKSLGRPTNKSRSADNGSSSSKNIPPQAPTPPVRVGGRMKKAKVVFDPSNTPVVKRVVRPKQQSTPDNQEDSKEGIKLIPETSSSLSTNN